MKGTSGLLFATCTLLLLSTFAGAQKKPNTATVTSADTSAVASAKMGTKHIFTATTPAGMSYKDKNTLSGPPTVPFPHGNKRWPGDLTYQGGPTIQSAEFHAIYIVNSFSSSDPCFANNASCWGNPEGFLASLSVSDFIHITDQYVGSTANARYGVGGDGFITYTPAVPHILTDADILAAVHLADAVFGWQTGYNGLVHVFLEPGQDECFDSTFSVCYSPDNPSTWFFCGYHGSADFSDVGHVLYSVEPYQNVSGCNVPPGGPQGQLADSTNNVLSHETFEAITDPDGDAMWNSADNGLYGQEIGDECSFLVFTPTNVYFNPSVFKMNGVKYAAQPEYSNDGHACMVSPD